MLSTQMYTIGASSYYYCNYGYVLKGAESRSCLENGTWSGRVPKCVGKKQLARSRAFARLTGFCSVVDCGKAEVPSGITLKYINDSTLAGSKVEYKCPVGQKVVGTATRACQPDGTWSEAAPKCIGTQKLSTHSFHSGIRCSL